MCIRDSLGELCPPGTVQPWMRGVRLIVREDAPVARLEPPLERLPRVRSLAVDFGPSAQQRALEEDSEDPTLPEERRAQALYSLAVIDYGYNRAAQAIARFDELLAYYRRTGNATMRALVMHGLGAVFERNADLERARHWYECAVVPTSESRVPVVMSMVASSLGSLGLREGRYQEALEYFEGCEKLASHTLDAGSKVRALEQKGLCFEKLGRLEPAIESWERALTLCRSVELPGEMRLPLLEHLQRGCSRLGHRERAASAGRDVEALTSGDLTAGDLTAGDLTAGDLTAGDLTAGDLTSGDLTPVGGAA